MPGDDSDDEPDLQWLLGFLAEPADSSSLLRHRFPSKVGGRPAWLHPAALPAEAQLRCPLTSKPRRFLLQVYAAPPEGSDEDHEGAFHRAVFLFISPDGARLGRPGAVAALRCQLPRRNPFYAAEPAPPDQLVPRALDGAAAEAALAADPWRVAVHERDLKQARGAADAEGPAPFPEWEIVVEREADVLSDAASAEDDDAADGGDGSGGPKSSDLTSAALRRRVALYERRVALEGELPDDELQDVDETVRDQLSAEDRVWAHFQAVTSAAPDNVLRYCIDPGAAPLWGRAAPCPGAIPPCACCGAPRRFEFQVLPQLLHYLDIDDAADDAPDWLTIAVYTCSKSCVTADRGPGGSAYVDEYVFVQPPVTGRSAVDAEGAA